MPTEIKIDMANMPPLPPEAFDPIKDTMIEALIKGGAEWRERALAAEAALAACKGMWGQYSPNRGPFTERANAEWIKDKKWVFDSSHHVSEIRPDGTRRAVGTFQHASDAGEAEYAVNLVRSGLIAVELQAAFFAGFAEGTDGGWVEGDPTPAWNEYLAELKQG